MRRHAPRPRRNPRPSLAFDRLEPRLALAGNLLISGSIPHWDGPNFSEPRVIREFGPDGTRLGETSTFFNSDLAVDADGILLRDSFAAQLPGNRSFYSYSAQPLPPENRYRPYGVNPAIAVSGHYAFLTRLVGPYNDLPGIIRLDTRTGELTPFAYSNEATDITAGLDGFIYAKNWYGVEKYDPVTLESLARVQNSDFAISSQVTVDQSGNIYTFSGNRQYSLDAISKFSPTGELIARISLLNRGFNANSPTDLELDPSGELWASFDSGAIALVWGDLSDLVGWFDSGLKTPYLAMAGAWDHPTATDSTFSVADVPSVIEGDSGSKMMEFQVTRTGDLSRWAAVDYTSTRTSNRTSTFPPRTYDDGPLGLVFAPGQSSTKILVNVWGDTWVDGDQPIRIRLSNPFRGQIGRGEATGIVIDDDIPPDTTQLPTLAISNPTVDEGGDASFVFTISRPFDVWVEFNITTVDGTAGASDYSSPPPGSHVSFAPGETSKTLRIRAVADDLVEPDETFSLIAAGMSGIAFSYLNNGTALATIHDVPGPPPAVSVSGDVVPEGDGESVAANARITLERPSGRVLTADYKIEAYDGAGRIDPSVPATVGRVTFQPGEAEQAVAFRTSGDRAYNGSDKVYRLTITRADSAILQGTADLRFRDDDPPPVTPLVLDTTSAIEGDDSIKRVSLRILPSPWLSRLAPVRYALVSGSARADSDFIGVRDGSVLQRPDIGVVIYIDIFGDRVHEADETLTIQLIPDPSDLALYQSNPDAWRATFTIIDDDPEVMPRTLAPVARGEAVDSDLDGVYDSVRAGSGELRIARDASGHTAALLEFDVSGVLLSETPDARFKFWIPQFDADTGEVTITGRPGDGRLGLDDALSPGTVLGRFTPDSLGSRTITLDRDTVAALARASRYLSLRLDLGEGHGRARIALDGRGFNTGNNADPFMDYSVGLVFDRTSQVANDDAYGTLDQRPVLLPMMGNDVLYIDGFNLIHVENGPKSGDLNWTAEGITYTARPGFFGTDSFTYTIDNSAHQEFSEPATVTIHVAHVNRPPVVENPTFVLLHAIRYEDSLRSYVRDEDGPAGPAFRLVTPPSHGKVTIQPDGRFVYEAIRNYYGVDTFQFQADDSLASSAIGTAYMMVTSNLEPLFPRPDTFSIDEDHTLAPAASVLDNDTLWVTDGVRSVEIVDGPKHGSLTLGQDGRFVYKSARDYSGSDTFSYQIRLPVSLGGAILQGPATVTIQVRPVNDAPVAVGEAFSLNEDTRLVITAPGLLRNDADVDSKSLRPVLIDQPLHGKVVVDPSGSFIYVPVKDYSGPDRFTYRVSDGSLASNLATVTLTVRPVDDAPVAAPDAFVVGPNRTLNVAGRGVLANDRDAEGAPLVAALVTPPPSAAGRLVFRKDGTFTFAPKASARGTFTFTYRVSDGKNPSAPTTVSLTIGAPTIKRARVKSSGRHGRGTAMARV